MRLVLAALCATTLAAGDAVGRTIEGHAYPASASAAGLAGPLALVGVGDADWGLWDIHTAALYLPPGTPRARALAATSAMLVIRYQRDLAAKDFRAATAKTFGAGLSSASTAGFADALARWNALYIDRADGREYRILRIPGRGAVLAVEDRELGAVGDDAFAQALLAIWLGTEPVDRGLRRQLLER